MLPCLSLYDVLLCYYYYKLPGAVRGVCLYTLLSFSAKAFKECQSLVYLKVGTTFLLTLYHLLSATLQYWKLLVPIALRSAHPCVQLRSVPLCVQRY
jgi:hypothetical protein